ncbi:hypothetical protein [Streptomyces sp. MS2.AVA.5]|uniref:Uncharacterized protein n=1 Tax=Streptomyces achmelvichensis TaxID=3134111 RepID=A0ACC6PKZ1_9ACTN
MRRPVTSPDTGGASCHDWRLTAVGTTLDLPGTKAAGEAFGRPPRSGRDEQNAGGLWLRMVGLMECGTHAVVDVAIGALRTGEQALVLTIKTAAEYSPVNRAPHAVPAILDHSSIFTDA